MTKIKVQKISKLLRDAINCATYTDPYHNNFYSLTDTSSWGMHPTRSSTQITKETARQYLWFSIKIKYIRNRKKHIQL